MKTSQLHSNKIIIWIILSCAIVTFPGIQAVALEWQHTDLTARAEIGQTLPRYDFKFTNSGSNPVKITDVRTSCGCLALNFDSKIIHPGQTGNLRVNFDRTGLFGKVSRTIMISTDEKKQQQYLLTLNADLPELLLFDARLVNWPKGAEATTKSISVDVNWPNGLEIVKAASNNSAFSVKLVTIKDKKQYRLDITPSDTSSANTTVIVLHAKEPLPPGTPRSVFAQVR